MILHLGYEELSALKEGVRLALEADAEPGGEWGTPQVRVDSRVSSLEPRLIGDIGIRTLHEQRQIAAAFRIAVEYLREEMEAAVLASHPADEAAVASYFGFAHAYAALDRLNRMGRQMEALIEVVTGDAPSESAAREFLFPD